MTNNPFIDVNDYISKYEINAEYGLNDEAAVSAINTFKTYYLEWKMIIGRLLNNEDGDVLYGNAIYVFAVAIQCSKKIPEDEFNLLLVESSEYERTVKYKYPIKQNIFFVITLIWLKKGSDFRERAVYTGEKYILYHQLSCNNTSYYNLSCYSFRKCNTFLYQSLINDTIQLSSPAVFNDIFDCPMFDFLEHGNDALHVLKEAYLRGVRIACFVNNNKLPVFNTDTGYSVREPKHKRDKAEYLNSLMWAHYADSHQGVCIKYVFPHNITQFGPASDSDYVCYFDDVVYTNQFPNFSKEGISVKEGFWYKSKEWEYENELRLLYFNPNNNDTYVSIPALNSIESVYFGVQCSPKDKETIMNILNGRKFIYHLKESANSQTPTTEEKVISFYQMEKDKNKYGAIKAVKIT